MCEMGITMPASQSCHGVYECEEFILRPGCQSVSALFFSPPGLQRTESLPHPWGWACDEWHRLSHPLCFPYNKWKHQFTFIKHTEQADWAYICLLGLPCKVPQTGWLKEQKFISQSSRCWESKIMVSVGVVSSWSLFSWLGSGHHLSLCSLDLVFVCGQRKRQKELLGVSSLRSPILGDQDPLLWPHLTLMTSLKALSPYTVILGAQAFNTWILRGTVSPFHLFEK